MRHTTFFPIHFSVLDGESHRFPVKFAADVGGGGGRPVPSAEQRQGTEGTAEVAEPVPAARVAAPHSAAAKAVTADRKTEPSVQTPRRALAGGAF